ncbi:helix-turn-helix domain-containing protein [Ancylobacter sp. A5.8]|uniref:helix-turn-helix transcriptional regulator n=1 Tax=Ancylobacter gelatini TaxID=2919920 RepID=UPI001F4E83B3|nr:helix-turn-helix domain-containing protein [Ancylobacter gelatini]MCJ8143834.1 helix-turn-helix domain-containing protein [Ancylobacter gelatini]
MEILKASAPLPTVGREELAEWLGVSPAHLYNKLPKLEREQRFPPKLPGSLGKWSRAAVLAWIDGTTGNEPPPAAPVAQRPATLEEIYGGAA